MYKWFLAWRYLHTKLIAAFGVASVMLCVAMVLVVMSVMGGFLDTVRARSRGLHSEIVLEGGALQGFPYYEEFGDYALRELSDVVDTATPAIVSYAIFRIPANDWTKPARVLGIRLDGYVRVNDFGKGLSYNQVYPGTTHLGEQAMPVAGYDPAADAFRLPPDLVAANAQWRAAETDPEAIAKYDGMPFSTSPYPYVTAQVGERVFAADIGEPFYADPKLPGIIVGADLLFSRSADGSFKRYLARGAQVALNVVPLTPAGTDTGEPPVRIPMRYADDSRSGIFEIDSMCVYVDFDMLQRKLAMDPQEKIDGGLTKARASQLLIGLKDGVELNAARDRIAAAWNQFLASLDPEELTSQETNLLSFVKVFTWEDLQRSLIAAVEKEKVLVTFLFGLISVVAIVLLGCIFYMIVEKKTRDIGILKSLGASSNGVGALFVLYAAAVGVAGSLLGTLIGCLFVWNINGIQDFLASLNPELRVWSAEIYSFDRIPEVVKAPDAIWIALVAVLASMVGSLIPAIIAGRVWPVSALRYE